MQQIVHAERDEPREQRQQTDLGGDPAGGYQPSLGFTASSRNVPGVTDVNPGGSRTVPRAGSSSATGPEFTNGRGRPARAIDIGQA